MLEFNGRLYSNNAFLYKDESTPTFSSLGITIHLTTKRLLRALKETNKKIFTKRTTVRTYREKALRLKYLGSLERKLSQERTVHTCESVIFVNHI